MRWIRWKGLIFFVCAAILFSIFWLVFMDVFVEQMVEKHGTNMVGAKVELDNADVTLFPLGLVLNRLQITNPDEPMTNAIEVARISFSLDGLNLLWRKVIIDEMLLNGVKVDTSRKTSGAIVQETRAVKDSPKRKAREASPFPSLEIPSVKAILDKEELHSLELVNSLRNDVEAEKVRWQQILGKIPDKKKFAEYEKRIEAAQSARKGDMSGILGISSEVVTIKNDIEQDLHHIQSVRKEFAEQLALLGKRMDEAIKAPQEDVRRLRNKYVLSPQGFANASSFLFGPKIGEWTDKAIFWYKKLKPALERATKGKKRGYEVVKPIRGSGVNVVYKEDTPLPDFLIRLIKASVHLQVGDIIGEIKNITPDQDILQIPLTFIFLGDKLKDAQSVVIDGTLDHIIPSRPSDIVNLRFKGYQLQDINFSDQQALPMTLKEGLLDLKMDAEMKGDVVSVNITAGFESVNILTESGKSAEPLVKSIASALSDISRFTLTVDITGSLGKYKTQITSDLDHVIKDAVGNIVKKQAASLENELKSAVFAKMNGPIKDLKESFDQLKPVGDELSGRLNQGKSLLSNLGVKGRPWGLKLPF